MNNDTEPHPCATSTTNKRNTATILRLPPTRQSRMDPPAALAAPASPVTAGASSASTLALAPADSPLDVLLATFGHDEACRAAARSGTAVGCQCGTKVASGESFAASGIESTTRTSPADDAAVVIGLALRYGRMLKPRRLFLPLGIVRALVRHVDAGDPAAALVWGWCVRSGLIGSVGKARPRLRAVAAQEVQP